MIVNLRKKPRSLIPECNSTNVCPSLPYSIPCLYPLKETMVQPESCV